MADPEPDDASQSADAAPIGDARRYLNMIEEAETYFAPYQEKADNVDKLYADLEKMANTSREREMQVFWANLEVLKPSIFARPPVPVVVPRFKDRKPIPRTTAEMLERCLTTSFSTEDIDAVMRAIRDDLAVNARGVPWLQFERKPEKNGPPYECIRYRHLERRDFLHGPARKWVEVPWVAKRDWLDRKEGLKRFGNVWLEASFTDKQDDKDEEKLSKTQKAPVWELWHKGDNLTVWVTPGVEKMLDKGEPELTLQDFFPCPRPAYGTLQRRTLKPIPEFLYYKDQIEEINELTARISALAESLRLKGFYAAGQGEVADVVEAALKAQSNNAVLIPVSNFASLGGTALKDAIVWLPVRDVAEVIKGCIELRRQLIDDVYQVTGLSDIMRGATDPNETLGAQELKSQYGSIRIRDRQAELVRVARDITRIAAEIMAENFSPQTLLAMSQMEIPPQAAVQQQAQQAAMQKQQIAMLMQRAQSGDPEVQALIQKDPERAKQLMAQAPVKMQQLDSQVQKLMQTPTVEAVMGFLRDQRIRPYVLDIETDSTIAPDENAQKKRATEFVTATGGFIGQVAPMVQQMPQLAPLAGSFLKYVASQFRAGRQLENDIDQFAEAISQPQPQQPSPEAQAMQAKAQADAEKTKAELAGKQQDAALKDAGEKRATEAHTVQQGQAQAKSEHEAGLRERESAAKIKATELSIAEAAEKHRQDMEIGALTLEKLRIEILAKQAEAHRAATEPAEGAKTNGAEKPEPRDDTTAKSIAALATALAAPRSVRIMRDSVGEMLGAQEVR